MPLIIVWMRRVSSSLRAVSIRSLNPLKAMLYPTFRIITETTMAATGSMMG